MKTLCKICFLPLLTGGLIPAGWAVEDRPGEAGILFKLKQKGITPGPRTTPDGKISVKIEGLTAQLIDARTGQAIGLPLEHRKLRSDSRITCYAFSPDGKRLAVGTGDAKGKAKGDSAGEVRVWDVATGRLLASIHPARGDIGYVKAITFAADNKTVFIDCDELSGK